MIKCNCTRYAVMNANDEVVYTSSGRAFYKTRKHAEAKCERSGSYGGEWRVVEVFFKELEGTNEA